MHNHIGIFRADWLLGVCVLPAANHDCQLGLRHDSSVSRKLEMVSAFGMIAKGNLNNVAFANHEDRTFPPSVIRMFETS